MGDQLQVDFVPDEQPRRSRGGDVACAVAGIVVVALAIVIFLRLLPLLVVVLGVAAVLAALSTWRSSRRRAKWGERFGQPVERVGSKTYFAYLAAWFVGMLAVLPLFMLAVALGVIAIILAGLVGIVLLIAALFDVG